MQQDKYHEQIVSYYQDTENAYKDSWDLNNSLAIHYGYWDEKVRNFPQSLIRMNEVMMESAGITSDDEVLDAGCGVGGSSIFLAVNVGCNVTGITLSPRQVEQAEKNAKEKGVAEKVTFKVMDYCNTSFPNQSFDVIWGCESICYASDKEKFIAEAWRLLRPGGRLVVADGFVTKFEYNDHPIIRKWLDGWAVNYLESPDRFSEFMLETGFTGIEYRDISKQARHSSKRLNRFYYLASLYVNWKNLTSSRKPTPHQLGNIAACRQQYLGMKKGLWQYGLITGKKSS